MWITVIWQQKKNGSVLFFTAKSVPCFMLQGGPTKGCVGITEGPVLGRRMGKHNLIGLKPSSSKVGWPQKFIYSQYVNLLLSYQVKGTGNERMKRSWIYGRCCKKQENMLRWQGLYSVLIDLQCQACKLKSPPLDYILGLKRKRNVFITVLITIWKSVFHCK